MFESESESNCDALDGPVRWCYAKTINHVYFSSFIAGAYSSECQ